MSFPGLKLLVKLLLPATQPNFTKRVTAGCMKLSSTADTASTVVLISCVQ
jgi:hypothetical protein